MNKLTIIYEDEVLLVCNKPAGLMVEPDRNNFPNLLQEVKKYLRSSTSEINPYVQHLHRLDRPTSGIVLFTKKKEHLRYLSEQFATRTVSKHYLAKTTNVPEERYGILEHWHRKEKKKAVIVPEGTDFAEKIKLEYQIETFSQFYLWKIKLYTGKYHQIRVQLASLGCPILGDELYGSDVTYKPNEIALHAVSLTVKHPVTFQNITFEADASDFLTL